MSRVIDEKYKALEGLKIKFEKKGLEDWLFEAACRILEKRNLPKDEGNLKGCVYLMLKKTVSRAEQLPVREKGYRLLLSEDYREIIIGEITQ